MAYSSQHHDHDDLLNATVDELVKRAKHASALEARLAEAQIALSNERQENQARSETVNDLEGELSLIRDQLSQDRKAQSEAARGDLRRLRDRLQKVEAASEAARDHHAAELGNAQLREDRLEERVREAHDHVEELTRKLEAARDQLAQERTHHERARSRLNERLAAAETAVLLERARQAHNTGDDWAAQTVPLLELQMQMFERGAADTKQGDESRAYCLKIVREIKAVLIARPGQPTTPEMATGSNR